MSDTRTPDDIYTGCLLGLALGDALGRPVEFMDDDGIRHHYGDDGIAAPPKEARYSDDTQLMLATGRGLLAANSDVLTDVLAAVRQEYLDWLRTQDSPLARRAPSVTMIEALQRLQKGMPPTAVADGGANEAITASRVAPVAIRYRGDLGRIIEMAAEIGRITHGHPGAVSGAAAAAMYVDFAAERRPLDDWWRTGILKLKRWCPDDTQPMVDALRAAQRSVEWPVDAAMEEQYRARPGYGGGWTADEAVGIAVWCFFRSPTDYAATVRRAANLPGESDADSIAAVAGAISGAYNGRGGIPPEWLDRLEDRETIETLAMNLLR